MLLCGCCVNMSVDEVVAVAAIFAARSTHDFSMSSFVKGTSGCQGKKAQHQQLIQQQILKKRQQHRQHWSSSGLIPILTRLMVADIFECLRLFSKTFKWRSYIHATWVCMYVYCMYVWMWRCMYMPIKVCLHMYCMYRTYVSMDELTYIFDIYVHTYVCMRLKEMYLLLKPFCFASDAIEKRIEGVPLCWYSRANFLGIQCLWIYNKVVKMSVN